jgi:hypothetical protein
MVLMPKSSTSASETNGGKSYKKPIILKNVENIIIYLYTHTAIHTGFPNATV